MSNFAQQLEKLPAYLGSHLMITVVALLAGLMISLPVAIAVSKWRPGRWPVLSTAGTIQTIPSLALLALMVPLLGTFGFWPAVIALTLYSILPILRNTVTGILGVDPAMTEAARGIGMTPAQILTLVELPLAAPVIIAGIRTATVWVVGIATLSTPVGQTSLGNYIFSGLQTRNWTAVLFGCVAAAALALVLDGLIALLQSATEHRSKPRALAAGVGLLIVFGGGMVAPTLAQWTKTTHQASPNGSTQVEQAQPGAITTVRVGAKTFTEQYILARLMSTRLENAGFNVQRTESLGSTVAFDALANNQIDVYVDYSGTIWANYMNREDNLPSWRLLDTMTGWLAEQHGIRNLGTLGFENTYALVTTKATADKLNLRTIADLAQHTPQMQIGGDYEFFSRPEWFSVRDTYGLNFANTINYDSTFMYQAVADGTVDVISAFSSDGRIAAYNLTTLADPKQALPPYDAVILLSPRVANNPQVVAALRPLINHISVEQMRQANQIVDVDRKTVSDAASWLDGTIPNAD